MLTQTLAILVDSYRELNAKKLFWITLAISGIVVAAFAAVGIDERGISAFGVFVGPWLNTGMFPRDTFYKFLFAEIGVPIWLTWGAVILALVSTAGMIPDFVTGGAIDVVLSKPIGRLRLFLTKYVGALLFVALQALAFSVAVFLVIGLRGGSWEPAVFLCVPLVVCFFSFIYCVCALIGLVTRSTIAALLGAVGFWLVVFAAGTTESIYLMVKVSAEQTVVALDERAASIRRELAAMGAPAAAPESAGEAETGAAAGAAGAGTAEAEPNTRGIRAGLVDAAQRMVNGLGATEGGSKREALEARLAKAEQSLERERKNLRSYQKGHSIALGVKSVLPKTSETMQLLSRSMLSIAEISAVERREDRMKYAAPRDPDDPAGMVSDLKAAEAVEEIVRERPVWWIVGTSLLFEAVIVALAARIFCRRDF